MEKERIDDHMHARILRVESLISGLFRGSSAPTRAWRSAGLTNFVLGNPTVRPSSLHLLDGLSASWTARHCEASRQHFKIPSGRKNHKPYFENCTLVSVPTCRRAHSGRPYSRLASVRKEPYFFVILLNPSLRRSWPGSHISNELHRVLILPQPFANNVLVRDFSVRGNVKRRVIRRARD